MRWAGHWNLTGERRGVCRVFAGEDLREGDHLEDRDADGRISTWTFKKWDGEAQTGLICLRVGTGGGCL